MRGWQAIAGAVAGTTAAGVAAGVAVERYAVSRLRGRLDADVVRGFHESGARPLTVSADDGVSLHVEVDDEESAGPTIIFCHGWTLEHASWFYQRRDLGDLGRLIFWDQCCHGRSERRPKEALSIDVLAADLRAIVDEAAPTGPLVLVGHSMGGMTIMAFADKYPRLFEERVVAVALISSVAGGLGGLLSGVYGKALRALAPPLLQVAAKATKPIERARAMSKMASYMSVQRLAFGSNEVAPEVVAFLDGMISATPVDVVADYYPAILAHDKLAALEAFRHVPTLVLVGSEDRLIPAEASRIIAKALPDAEFVEVPRAGHAVMLERPELVNAALRTLVRAACPATEAGERQ